MEVTQPQLEWYNLFVYVTEGKNPRVFLTKDILTKKFIRPELKDYITGGKSDGAFLTAANALINIGAVTKLEGGQGWMVNTRIGLILAKTSRHPSPKVIDKNIVTVPVEEPETIRATDPPVSSEDIQLQPLCEKPINAPGQDLESGYKEVAMFRGGGFEIVVYRNLLLLDPSSEGQG